MSEKLSAQRKSDELRMDAADRRQRAASLHAEADRLDEEAARWAAGADGERRVAAILDPLTAHGAVVMHDRLLKPGISRANLDHIVATKAGVYFIDTKNWSGDLTVHDASLWQHTTSADGRRRASRHLELDKVSRAAAAMETAMHGPVVPVIALANTQHSHLIAERVRGVHVVPASQLVSWLEAQAAWLSPAQVDLLRLTLDAFFPPAGQPLAVDPSFAAVTVPRAGRRQTAHRPRPSTARVNPRPRGRAASRTGWKLARILLLLAVAAAVGLNLPRILPFVASLVQPVTSPGSAMPFAQPSRAPSKAPSAAPSAASLTLLDGSPAPYKPCAALTTQAVQDVLGVPLTEHDFTKVHDYCGWHVTPPANPYVPAELSVSTGWTAKNAIGGLNEVKVTATAGTATISVPQRVAVPGAPTPASAITQPFQVTYRYTYPAKAKAADITAADKLAADKVTQVAQLLATRLPQGSGADDTTPKPSA